MPRHALVCLLILAAMALNPSACLPSPALTGSPAVPSRIFPNTAAEVPVTTIPFKSWAAKKEAELSGLAWYGDTLILLPQYPDRMPEKQGGTLFGLKKQDILDFLDGKSSGPLVPFEIPFDSGGIERKIGGFNGFEAIAFQGNHVILTIEALQWWKTKAYLVAGEISPDLSLVRLDPNAGPVPAESPLPLNLYNMGDEALLVAGEEILALYEVNGALNLHPSANRFDASLHLLGTLPFPSLEFRVTDATPLDEQDRFWVINYKFPDNKELLSRQDPLAEEFGRGLTHAKSRTVERLVELQYSPAGITLSGVPPVQLQLLLKDSRNWEGLARLEGRGFLLVTDTYPETILGFIHYED